MFQQIEFNLKVKFGLSKTSIPYHSITDFFDKVSFEQNNWSDYLQKQKVHNINRLNDERYLFPFASRQLSFYTQLLTSLRALIDNTDETIEKNTISTIQIDCNKNLILEFNSNLARYLLSIETETTIRDHLKVVGIINPDNLVHITSNRSQGISRYGSEALIAAFYDDHPDLQDFDKVSDIERSIRNLASEFEGRSIEWLKQANLKLDDFSKKADIELAEKKKRASEFLKDHQTGFDNLKTQTGSDFDKIKQTYSAHLMLAEPAKYWRALRLRYTKVGNMWRTWSIVIVGLIIFISIIVLTRVDNILLSGDTDIIILHKTYSFDLWFLMKWLIVLGLLYSSLIYLLSLFVKLTLSAYHMSRDAEERYILTQVYLALTRDASTPSMGVDQIAIVFSSIFSRVDTGLLKGDSSPSIISPSSILAQVIGSNGKSHS